MKPYINLFLFFFVLTNTALAQMTKQESVNFPVPSSKKIEANLKFAHKIDIKPSTNQQVVLKKTILYSEESLLEIDQQSAEEKSGVLVIETDYKMQKDKSWNRCFSCDPGSGSNCVCFRISYELLLPAGLSLQLKTISGDITIANYSGGEMELESISGGIEIKDYKGAIRAKSISGFVDFTSPGNQGFDVASKSVTGEIYTDFDIKLDDGSTAWSKRLNRSLNGGGKQVSLETVSGDIYLRKGN